MTPDDVRAMMRDGVASWSPVKLRAAVFALLAREREWVDVPVVPAAPSLNAGRNGALLVDVTCSDCGTRTSVPLAADPWCRHCAVGR